MARGAQRESLPKPIPFDSFSLEEFPLEEVPREKRANMDPRVSEREGVAVCTFRNPKTGRSVNGTLSVHSHVIKEYIEKTLTFEKIRVTAATKGTEIYLGLGIYDRPELLLISTDIARQEKRGKQKLPSGTGIMLYEKALDYIASRARTKPLIHTVNREAVYTADTSLTRSQWQSIFPPILSRRGYRELRDGVWEKEYSPDSSAS